MQVAVARHILQELSREDVAVRALGHGDLRQRLPAGRQAFYHELGGLAAQRDHLQVEVTLPEAHLVQGGELHHHLLVDAERPALVVEQQAPEPHLRAEKNRGCQSIPCKTRVGGVLLFGRDVAVNGCRRLYAVERKTCLIRPGFTTTATHTHTL